ncbi:MAG: pyridoxal-phosphate dependent enzyme, partial [Chloroflexi bacterium]|nr:pyridoxal-phosphate dependent enzyme [Chloroflexota bacterium]
MAPCGGYVTPLSHLRNLSGMLGIDLWVKRDDLWPISGGGNKGRKGVYIMRQAHAAGANAVVTTGGVQSNHARAIALLAASRGWKCRLVLHGPKELLLEPYGNLRLMVLSGADITVVQPSDIAAQMSASMEALRAEGYVPFEIPGGGHLVEGARAYVDAASELVSQCREQDWQPEVIVLASGTGTTQAGLLVGLALEGVQASLIGVSVARRNPRGQSVVSAICTEVAITLHLGRSLTEPYFRDDWVGEGYERADSRVHETIGLVARTEGLVLDPT